MRKPELLYSGIKTKAKLFTAAGGAMNHKGHFVLSLTLIFATAAVRADDIDDYVKAAMQKQQSKVWGRASRFGMCLNTTSFAPGSGRDGPEVTE